MVWSSITVFTTLNLNLSHFSGLGILPWRLAYEGRIGRISTSRRLSAVIAGANLGNLALFIVVIPTFLLKLIMPRLLRRGKLLIRLLGVLLKLDVGTSINFFLTWVLGGAFGLAGPRLAEPTVPTGPSLRM